jgi:phage gp46-like protein
MVHDLVTQTVTDSINCSSRQMHTASVTLHVEFFMAEKRHVSCRQEEDH